MRLAASIASRTYAGAPGGGTARPSAIVAPQVALVRSAAEDEGPHSTLFGRVPGGCGRRRR